MLKTVEGWHGRHEFRKGQGKYDIVTLRLDGRHLQVSVSPAGRSWRVFLDNEELVPRDCKRCAP